MTPPAQTPPASSPPPGTPPLGTPSPGTPLVTAAFLIIGDEILSGRTPDANLAFLAQALNQAGIRLMEARVVRDEEAAIVAAVRALSRAHDHVFTSGGIGPTHDDITCASVARAFGRKVVRHPEALRRLEQRAAAAGIELNAARRRMADTPEGAVLIDNRISAAPGFTIANVHVMAGVPQIFQAMVASLLPRLGGGARLLSLSLAIDLGEGAVAEPLGAVQARHGDVAIGSYPSYQGGRAGTTLVLRGPDRARLAAVGGEVRRLVRDHGGSVTAEEEE